MISSEEKVLCRVDKCIDKKKKITAWQPGSHPLTVL